MQGLNLIFMFVNFNQYKYIEFLVIILMVHKPLSGDKK